MPVSASSKPFLTRPSFDFYSDVSKNGLLVHWNFSNLNCFDYTNPISTIVNNLVSNGTGNGNVTSGWWNSGYIREALISGGVSSTTFIESNNKITIEWVGTIRNAFPSSDAFVNKGGSFRLNTINFSGINYFTFGIDIGGGTFSTMIMISKPITIDRTYYVTATFDGFTKKLFVFDTITGMTTQTASLTATLSPTGTGFTANSTGGYATRSLKFYNRILSDTEILYNRRYVSYF
jgi:hypothetical protein